MNSLSYHYKKLPSKYVQTIPPRLMSDTVEEIFQTFQFFDFNGNQSIEINELKRLFQGLNMKKSSEQCRKHIRDYDLNGDEKIDFHEFIFAMARLIKHDVFTLNDIQQKFKYEEFCMFSLCLILSSSKFDDDQDGKLTISVIPLVIRKGFGIPVTDREIVDLLAQFRITDETKKISLEKFLRMLQYLVRQGEQPHANDYMKKLNHRCGPALRNLQANDIKLLKKRTGGNLSSVMEDK